MKRNTFIPILIIGLLFASGCTSLVTNVDLPEMERKLVVHSFISPQDDMITVRLSESLPLFDTMANDWEIHYYDKADVFISQGSVTKQMMYDMSAKAFKLDVLEMPILAGNTYKVKVIANDGREVEAEATVPAMTQHNLVLEDTTTVVVDEYGYADMIYKFRFKDPAGVKNYYRIIGVVTWESNNFPGDTLQDFIYNDAQSDLIDDANFDGGSYVMTYRSSDYMDYTMKSVRMYFYVVDESYYKFHRGLDTYVSENPFMEPTLVYTNVKDGRGVVAAYNLEVVNCPIP